jgi:hypothetical protein
MLSVSRGLSTCWIAVNIHYKILCLIEREGQCRAIPDKTVHTMLCSVPLPLMEPDKQFTIFIRDILNLWTRLDWFKSNHILCWDRFYIVRVYNYTSEHLEFEILKGSKNQFLEMASSPKEVDSLEKILESNLPPEELNRAWKILYGTDYPPK